MDEKFNFKIADASKATAGIKSMNQQIQAHQNQMAEEMAKSFALKEQKEQDAIKREIEQIELTKQIAENTAFLPEMVGLIRENNNINKEMLELYKEMLNVTTAQTEEEAKNIIWEVLDKAKSLNQSISAVSGLMKYGEALINTIF